MSKTISVSVIKDEINRILKLDHIPDCEKKALCEILECFLFKSKNYKGYTYYEIFTPAYHLWKAQNPEKSPMDFVKHEWNRSYI